MTEQNTDKEIEEVGDILSSLSAIKLDGNGPLYVQISSHIQGLMDDGRLPEGTTLPSERRLAEILGVSRITAQHSYNELRQLGLLRSQGRRGSVVCRPAGRIMSPMNRLRGFTEEMQELGKIPMSRIVCREITSNPQVATIFGLPSSAKLLHLQRIRFADGIPLSNEKAWYNLAQVPALANGDLSGSVYAELAKAGHPLAYCEQIIDAVIPTEEDCKIFEIDIPLPCILIKRRSFTNEDVMLEYVEGTFRGDVYSYRMKLNV